MPRPGLNPRGLLGICWVVLLLAAPLWAQQQGTATLAVSMQVTSSISLVFESYPGGCTLSNSGTNNVGMDMGWADNVNGHGGCATYSGGGGGTYTVSTPLYVNVTVTNSSSTRYDLRAWMSSPNPIPGKISFLLNGLTLGNSRPSGALQTNAYGRTTETFGISVQKQVAAQTMTFVAQFEAIAR